MISAVDYTTSGAIVVIVGAVMTFLGVLVTAVFSYLGHKEAKGANAAVNHKGPEEDRLFDMVVQTRNEVKEIRAWKQEKVDLDAEVADKLVSQFKAIDNRIITTSDMLSRRITHLDTDNAVAHSDIFKRLDHVEWKLDTQFGSTAPTEESPV